MVERGPAAAVVDIMKERFLMIAAAVRTRKSANPSFISTLSTASLVARMIPNQENYFIDFLIFSFSNFPNICFYAV